MNSIQVKIRVNRLETSCTQDDKIVVNGQCSFQFWDKGENQVRPLQFQAFGQPAIVLQQAGIGSVHIVNGRLNIYPRSPDNPNERSLLTISSAIPLVTAQSPSPTAQAKPIANVPELVTVGSSNGKVAVAPEEIPL